MSTHVKITLTDRRPVSVPKADWPIVARADWFNGNVECQANTERHMRVREHADGRHIVYGWQEAGPGGQHAGTRNPSGGYLLAAGEDVANSIRAVGSILGDDDLARWCLADMPAEDVT